MIAVNRTNSVPGDPSTERWRSGCGMRHPQFYTRVNMLRRKLVAPYGTSDTCSNSEPDYSPGPGRGGVFLMAVTAL